MAEYNSNDPVNFFGWLGTIGFNVLGIITTDELQKVSFAAAIFSAMCVGVHHIVKTIYTIKGKRHENKDHRPTGSGSSNPGDRP